MPLRWFVSRCVARSLAILVAAGAIGILSPARLAFAFEDGQVASEAVKERVVVPIKSDDELLRLAKQAVAQSASKVGRLWGAQVDPVAAPSGPVRWVRHRVRKDWIEFGDTLRVPDGIDTEDPFAVQKLGDLLEGRYGSDRLSKSILSIETTRLALATCNGALKLEVRTLQPPHFNNDTGIRWYPDQGKLAYESIAVTDLAQNRCIRGIVDLHDGQVACTELACVVR
jgi:hypothetical protein